MGLRVARAAALLFVSVAWQGCQGGQRDGRDGSAPRDVRPPDVPDAVEAGARPRAPEKLVEIDLATQRLRTYEDGRLVRELTVSTGKRDKTPTGEFRIWRKFRLKDMKVGLPVRGEYYVLEDVPWIMYFFNAEHPKEQGLAIHGTWWHADFGKPASHGCVNLPVEEARELFLWTDPPVGPFGEATAPPSNPGTRVVILDSADRDGS
jgi:hypothetical protein